MIFVVNAGKYTSPMDPMGRSLQRVGFLWGYPTTVVTLPVMISMKKSDPKGEIFTKRQGCDKKLHHKKSKKCWLMFVLKYQIFTIP